MVKYFVVEISSDGDLDLYVFNTKNEAGDFINARACEIYEILLDEFSENDLFIEVYPEYARVSIEAPGKEFDRILHYRTLEV